MSANELMQAACAGKHPFPTMRGAMNVAKRAKTGGAIAYRCPHCGKYHIGHDEKHSKANRRRAIREFAEK